MSAMRVLRTPDSLGIVGALVASLITAALILKAPPPVVLGVAAVFALVIILGIETLIAIGMLGAFGLIPFLDPNRFILPQVKAYAFMFLVAVAAMIAAWAGRELSGRKHWGMPTNALSLGLAVLLAYVAIAALATHPTQVPALVTPFFILPISGLAVILWLSHDEALDNLLRVLPIVIVVVAAWAIFYDIGAAGCGPCRTAVGTEVTNTGLLGPGSRLYTSGQNSFLALFVIAVAYLVYRPRPFSLALVGLGALTIALQDSRAQYIGVLAAVVVLLAWKFRQLPSGGRVALILISGLIFLALALSPVGHRAALAYTELHKGSGTGDYRLHLIEETQRRWTFFGLGFSSKSNIFYDVDLGLPNTILLLGYAGAVLQLSLLGIGIWRGLKASTLVGATVAAILLLALVTRPSLPLLEYGHSAAMFGSVLGFGALISIPVRRRAQNLVTRPRRAALPRAAAYR